MGSIKRTAAGGGYWFITKKGHPMADAKGRILEHRYVMSEFMGRPLASDEIVHHKDEDRGNNDISNLEIMTPSQHGTHHSKPAQVMTLICKKCGKEVFRSARQVNGKRLFCSRSCSASFYGRGERETLPHGYGKYRSGCRCRVCRQANCDRMKNYYAQKRKVSK